MMRFAATAIALTIFASDPLLATPERASPVCEREMVKAAKAFDVPLAVLYAVGLTETGRRGSLQPYAMNIEGHAVFPDDLPTAMSRFAAARASGVRLIDIGCMQINHRYHGAKFNTVADMFDPARNVAYAAQFLSELRKREPSWTLAVARYHAGPDNDAAQKRYVCAVLTNIVASGFGTWTSAAAAFCDQGASRAAEAYAK